MRRSFIAPARLWSVLLQSFLLLSSAAVCQIATTTAPMDPSATYTVSGTVVNSVTGAPIRRALVRLSSAGEHLALTDSNGQFEFKDLPSGRARLLVHKPGFFAEDELERRRPRLQFVTIGPNSSAVILQLIPQSVIYGHVRNPDGEPLERIQVKVIASRVVEGRKRWQIVSVALTNEDGEFRIANLQPGSYFVEAEPNVGSYYSDILPGTSAVPTSARDEGYATSFYPAGTDMSSASPLELSAGQETDVEFSLRRVPVYKVSGTVAGYPPNSGVQIIFLDRGGNQFSTLRQFNLRTGQFQAEIPAGSYTLKALGWMPEGKQLTAEIPVNITNDTAGIALALTATVPTPIIVRAEGKKSDPDPANLVNLHLIPADDSIVTSELWSSWQAAKPKPMLVLDGIPPGRYSVEVRANGNWYVESAQCGTTDLLHEELTVSAGTQIPPVYVVLRDDAASLSGHINSNQSANPVTVLLVPDHGPADEAKTTNAGPDGSFFFSNLAPGNYSVLALDSADGLDYANPGVMDEYSAQAAHVSLQPNDQSQVAVEVTHVAD